MIKECETKISDLNHNVLSESKNEINTQKKEFVYDNIKKVADIWGGIDNKSKNMILKSIISKIVVVNNDVEIQLKNF